MSKKDVKQEQPTPNVFSITVPSEVEMKKLDVIATIADALHVLAEKVEHRTSISNCQLNGDITFNSGTNEIRNTLMYPMQKISGSSNKVEVK